MRAAIGPTARGLDGTAEAMPLPDDSADAVTVGQAFHWFDGPEALAEIERVRLRRPALADRRPSESSALHAAISEMIAPYRGDAPATPAAPGAALRRARADRAPLQRLPSASTPTSPDRVGSTSFVAALDDASESAARVRAPLGDGPVDVPYECEIHLWRLDVIDRGAEHRAGDARLRRRSRPRPCALLRARCVEGYPYERRHLRATGGAAGGGRSPSCACLVGRRGAPAVDVAAPAARRSTARRALAALPARGRSVVGRSRGCDVVMPRATVSRRHSSCARRRRVAGGLSSGHGTWLMGGAAARTGVPRDERSCSATARSAAQARGR